MNIIDDIKLKFDLSESDHYLEKIFIPTFPKDFSVGIIIGASGSGKTTILKSLGDTLELDPYDTNPICESFSDSEEAIHYLKGVGLNSIPTWIRPIDTLSMGEQYRARLALTFSKDKPLYLVDEFTSTLDRESAKSICSSINKGITRKNIVVATGHEDITEWLKADWIYNVETASFKKQTLDLSYDFEIKRVPYQRWEYYKKHHYLTGNLNRSSRCYEAYVNGKPAGFQAIQTLPSGSLKNAFRSHRLVTVPKYQGLGVGTRLSHYISQLYVQNGKRMFTKTSNVLLGEYRQKSPLWRPTVHNLKPRRLSKNNSAFNHWRVDTKRICYTHEYIGETNPQWKQDLENWGLTLDTKSKEQMSLF